ncbi:MAG: FKBP-type peptidyl-prolyl cis-trans isomerase [Candidatus Bathyarchaeia archaeon]|nr:peptidylprolyl isomerase [Candidatus Bathyarchaeota archaeon A05DMB-4]MDH7594627.1 FKBP-type peptidyl-prolyl cis-trans isomerase [Candidatus Bathyarchaeota archaeon]
MAFEKGSFILIDYVAKVKETGEVFDTTKEDIAKKEHLYKEGEIYEPKLVVLGEGWVLKALDEGLTALELEKPSTIEIPPDQAFGPRDPEKVRLVPMRRLVEKGITPQLGARIEFNGKPATIRTMGAGRVQLDFNPPLAGKTLVYEVTVLKKLEANEEKISALLHRRIPLVDASKFEFKLKKTEVTVNMPEEAFYLEGIQVAKRGISMDIQKFFPEIDTVEFVEAFKRQKPAAPSATTTEASHPNPQKKQNPQKPQRNPHQKPQKKKNSQRISKKTLIDSKLLQSL